MFSNALKLKETSKLGGEKRTEILYPSDELVADGDREDFLLSINKIYKLVNQKDGNLVLYNVSSTPPRATWNSKTNNKGFNLPTRLVLQPDGNLVLYDRDRKVMWASATKIDTYNSHYLCMQDDGNLVLYDNKFSHRPQWSTGTYDGRIKL